MNPIRKMMLALRALVDATPNGKTPVPCIPALEPAPTPTAPPDDLVPYEPFDAHDEEIRKLRAITVHLQYELARLRDYSDVACVAISEARDIAESSWRESEQMKQNIVTAVEAFKEYLLP